MAEGGGESDLVDRLEDVDERTMRRVARALDDHSLEQVAERFGLTLELARTIYRRKNERLLGYRL